MLYDETYTKQMKQLFSTMSSTIHNRGIDALQIEKNVFITLILLSCGKPCPADRFTITCTSDRCQKESPLQFTELNIIPPILRAIEEEGYLVPTPIQEETIPVLLQKRDLVGCAQTGTGKTAAFAIPILQLLSLTPHNSTHKKAIRALILTPTRELAVQIGESLDGYGRHLKLKTTVVFGGVSQNAQTNILKNGVDILVATPGRLLDLIGQKFIELHHIEIFVLDEADRMLDMGFAPDVKRVIGMLPEIRQNMLFSATMPPEITKLVDKLLVEPVRVAVTPISSTVDIIDQSVYFVGKKEKRLLLNHLLKNPELRSVLIFSRTKHGADRITKDLERANINVSAIHGDKSQNNRQIALNKFKAKQIRVLVATDIAARGIDVDDLSHVINYDLPNVPETYIHRIGRTGRAGLGGTAISFCDEEEKSLLKDIQKLLGKQVPIITEQPYPLENYIAPPVVEGDHRRRPDNHNNDRLRPDNHNSSRSGMENRNDNRRRPDNQNDSRRRPEADKPEIKQQNSIHSDKNSAIHHQKSEEPSSTRTVQNHRSIPSKNVSQKSGSMHSSSSESSRTDRKPLEKEAYERMAKKLDNRTGAGSGSRNPSRQRADSRPDGKFSGNSGRTNQSSDNREHRQNNNRNSSQTHAASEPGPYERSSFLSKPLKSRPKGL